MLLGLQGSSPGKSLMGLRVVRADTGTPPGLGPALLRCVVLGVATLPTFGLGVATLAQTAVLDPRRQRRGWHDHRAHTVVVDVRPPEEQPDVAVEGPRQVVNLTAMRLAPTPAPAAAPIPPRKPAPAAPTAAPPAAPTAASPVPAAPQPAGTPPVVLPPGAPPGRVPLPPGAPPGRHAAPPSTPPTGPPTGPPPTAPISPPTPTPASRPDAEDDVERTVIRGSGGAVTRGGGWRVSFDTGESFVVEGLALVGRRPEGRPGEPVRHVVPLPSQDMSVSKTHAQVQVAGDGVLVVMDRGSTNGSVLVRSGVARDLPPGRPTTLLDGDVVRFGDRSMTVALGS